MCTPHSYSKEKFVFRDTANKSAFSEAAAFSDAQKACAPRHSHSHKSVFSDTAKKSAFSDTAAFSDAQKTYAPRHSHSNDKSVFSNTAIKRQRLVTLQRLISLRKDGHPGIYTAMTSLCLVTRRKGQRPVTLQRLLTLRKDVHPRHSYSHDKFVFSDTAKK